MDKIKSKKQLLQELALIRTQLTEISGQLNLLRSRERIESERLNQENLQAKLANAIEMAHLGPWEYDVVQDTFIFNDYFYKMFRTTADQVGGYTMASAEYARRFVHPDEIAIVGEEVRKAKETSDPGYSRQFEHRIIYADGAAGYINVRFFIQKDAQGQTVRTYGVNQDITDRKLSEEVQRQLNVTLGQRTALAETRANQLQGLAVELIEAEERERRRVAELLHDDLQQMLSAAKMQLQAVSLNLSEPVLLYVEQLLQDSIDKSRRLSHELSPPVLNHSGLVAALKWLAARMEEQFGLQVEFEADADGQFDNEPVKVFMFRAVQELLFNIVKHAGVKIARVQICRKESNIVTTVSDRGRGFISEVLNSTSEKAGFGLMSIRERASYIGGGLEIESTPGKGSRFTLTLPLDLTVADTLQTVSDTLPPYIPADRTDWGDIGGIRVLFVDDHQVMRQGLIRVMAGKPGIQVAGEASNGREAVEQARRLQPDVIIMDISMPEMDGLEATRRIKAEFPCVHVIGFSMHEDDQIVRNMRAAGAEAFVSKAASSAELLRAIYEAVRES